MTVIKIELYDAEEREIDILTSLHYTKEQAIRAIQHEEKHGAVTGIMTFDNGDLIEFDNESYTERQL